MRGTLHSLAETALSGLDITGLTADSRRVAPGYLFAALPGAADGRAFIAGCPGAGRGRRAGAEWHADARPCHPASRC